MKKNFLIGLLLVICVNCFSQNVGIGTAAPLSKLQVNGSIMAFGATGSTPVSGGGTRLMWVPEKKAFRAGELTGAQWNDDSLGLWSVAMGYNPKALGGFSFSMGSYTTASGNAAAAIGNQTISAGDAAFAVGILGSASGDAAAAFGRSTKAKGFSSFVIGTYNDSTDNSNPTLSNPLNRIFQVGNGTADNARSNAVTILQNGKMGIGILTPTVQLDIKGDVGLNDSTLHFRSGADRNHGLRFNNSLNGPYLFGFNGGALGTIDLPHTLLWDYAGNVAVRSSLAVDDAGANSGLFSNVLQFGNLSSGEGIGSNRTNPAAGMNQYGIDLYTAGFKRMVISNGGNVGIGNISPAEKLDVNGNGKLSGNLTVQNGKGIIRNTDGTQAKKLSASVVINTAFTAGETKSFTVTWPETFSGGIIEAYVGNVTGGAGGWAEVVMTISGVSTTGAQLYVYNPKTTGVTPNFTIKVIAIGPQ